MATPAETLAALRANALEILAAVNALPSSYERELAITHFEEAIMWLDKATPKS